MESKNLRERFEFHKKWLEAKLHDEETNSSKRDRRADLSQSPHSSYRGKSEPPQKYSKAKPYAMHSEILDDMETVETLKNIDRSQVGSYNYDKENEEQENPDDYFYRDFMDDEKRTKRWEKLYSLNKKIVQQKKINSIINEEKKNEVDPECTFKPKLVSSTPFYATNNTLSIHDRNLQWKERREAKIAMSREMIKDKDLTGCTFKPEVHRKKGSNNFEGITEYQSKGIVTYLQRQIVARKVKEEKEILLNNPLKKLQENIYKRESKSKVPEKPKFYTKSSIKSSTPTPRDKYYKGMANTGKILTNPLEEKNPNVSRNEEFHEDNDETKDPNFVGALTSLHEQLYRFDINYG